jgi:arginine/ornithine N-succinyltransferase beta subunit
MGINKYLNDGNASLTVIVIKCSAVVGVSTIAVRLLINFAFYSVRSFILVVKTEKLKFIYSVGVVYW